MSLQEESDDQKALTAALHTETSDRRRERRARFFTVAIVGYCLGLATAVALLVATS